MLARRLDGEEEIAEQQKEFDRDHGDRPPYTCGKNTSTAAIETDAVSHTTAPHAAASQRPTAATRSITAKNTVAVCHGVGWYSKPS